MILIVHITVPIAILLVPILKVLGITMINGHLVTVAYLSTLPVTILLPVICSSLGLTLSAYGTFAADKSLKILMRFIQYGSGPAGAALITGRDVKAELVSAMQKAISEQS
jgi:hypothetical protein